MQRIGYLGLALALVAWPAQAAPARPHMWVTAGNQHLAEQPVGPWHAANARDAIVIEPNARRQRILGFGAAFTDAACYMVNQLSPQQGRLLLEDLYGPKGLGLSVGRLCIGSSDYATKLYSYDEGEPDPELKRFSIDHDKQWILPTLRLARKVNPNLYLFGSPWSPPGWMKPNNSMLGGVMQRKSMEPYANYFVKFLQAYEAAGVPVQAVTIQNEVDTDQDGRMPACAWPQEYEMDFAAYFLAPSLQKAKLPTKVWLIDHNYSLWGRALDELEHPDVRKVAGAIAWHGYVGDPGAMSRVHNAYPDVDMHWTEGGPDITQPDYQTDWVKWSTSFTGILRNWCRSITTWNLALDEAGKPNIGPFPCGGLVTIDSKTKAVSYSGQYRALAHFSKFIKPGSTILSSRSTGKAVEHVAARTPDGKTVLVLTNAGTARKVSVQVGGRALDVALPAGSVATLSW